MNILILGGTGFIGMKLSELFASDQHNVRVLSPSAGRTILPKNVTGISGFIADKGLIEKEVEWADCVVHLVSTTTPKSSFSDPYHDVSSNLLPLVQLLQVMKDFAPDKKIIFCSSGGAVYGTQKIFPVKEDYPRNPSTSYGLVKAAMEDYVLFFNKNFSLPYLIVRPSNIYGLKLRSIGEQGIISTVISNTLRGKPTDIWANPENVRDYIYVDDFAGAIQHLVNTNQQGIFNIGSGEGKSLNDIFSCIESHLKQPVLLNISTNFLKDEPSSILDISNLQSVANWEPQVSLEDGIEIIIDHLRNSSSK